MTNSELRHLLTLKVNMRAEIADEKSKRGNWENAYYSWKQIGRKAGKQKQNSYHGNQKLDVINRGKKWWMRQVTAVLKTSNAISLGGIGGNGQNDQQEVTCPHILSFSWPSRLPFSVPPTSVVAYLDLKSSYSYHFLYYCLKFNFKDFTLYHSPILHITSLNKFTSEVP